MTFIVTFAALAVRVLLILYSKYHDSIADKTGGPYYTDVDYRVITDAAELVYNGHSPYERQTYRYTPILSWITLPNVSTDPSFGKYLFSFADVIVGLSIERILVKYNKKSNYVSRFMWLFNPIVISISTRGSPESLIGVLVMTTLDLILHESYTLGAVVMAFSVHYKIYPFIYSTSILVHLWVKHRSIRLLLWFSVVSLVAFAAINAAMYNIYGMDFLQATYLYHIGRKDHRHNFTPYFYPTYLTYSSDEGLHPAFSLIPQLVLALGLGVYGAIDLPLAWFFQTFAFVTFNRVCTSQYFLWYIWLLPVVLPSLKLSKRKKITLPILWISAQAVWLSIAYKLEFLGQPVFIPLWIASLFWFIINVYVLGSLIRSTRIPSTV
ncbi:hypothetical protein E3Q10_00998 [Wallemia mellicola]|uniref:GPI mannosyltransferase 1 n=1 Tax=Wallemia mellicola TaxID=1708541 RepID=A0A4T0QN61_9BASI|nr:hypothetical protein E3Q24_00515 [Wallemia mellicola]TIC26195.1 hypothetical protein E3Q12_00620 [Wallemia mellicola]TIC32976.1 hypothetical protein E3Q10_00998 [Wallemia mellicola]TIC75247.1 hypothetical protein E3Q00_00987 [Wallemia mellicola]